MEEQTHAQRRSYITMCLLVGFVLVTAANGKPTANESASQLRVKLNTVQREVLDNREQQVKLIKNKDPIGRVTSFIGLDYAERLVSIYVPEQEACFLIGGIMKEAGSFEDDPYIDIKLASQVPNVETGTKLLKYSVNDANPVTNTALLTKILSTNLNCNGTNTYWVERNEALGMGTGITTNRKKRGIIDILLPDFPDVFICCFGPFC